MVRLETIKNFELNDFEKLQNVNYVRKSIRKQNELLVDDTFECDEDMARYLLGANKENVCVVRILEIIPEKKNKKTSKK